MTRKWDILMTKIENNNLEYFCPDFLEFLQSEPWVSYKPVSYKKECTPKFVTVDNQFVANAVFKFHLN